MSRKAAMNARNNESAKRKIINDFLTLRAYHFANIASLREIILRDTGL